MLAASVVAFSASAHAAGPGVVLDQIVGKFQAASTGWQGALRGFAMHTFGILALIEFAWAAIGLAFRRSAFDEWLAELVNQIMFLGFFFALLINSVTWSRAIVDSFRYAATGAGGVGVNPSDVLSDGIKLATQTLNQMTIWHPEASAGLMIAGLVVMACFALMAAEMVLALIESYIVISMSVLFMAFGGTRWTKDIAVSTIRYAISVGARLFCLQLLLSVGMNLIADAVAGFTDFTNASLCVLIGTSIALLAIVSVVPRTMQAVINGSSMAHGGALLGAAAGVAAAGAGMAAGATAIATGVAGAGAATGSAARLGLTQLAARDAAGTGPTSRIGRAATLAGYTARNLGSAATSDLGARLSGQGARHGMAPWRMTASLQQRNRLTAENINRPRLNNDDNGNNSLSA